MLDLFPSREAGRFGRRLKRARGAKIPVSVLTGFLGAGKTTLLRRFLAKPEGEGTAVVINEFGSVGTRAWSAEARKQVILADRLVVTKSDLAEPQAVEQLARRLRALNPRAAVHIAVDGDLDPRFMLESDAPPGAAARTGFVAEAE